MHTCRSMGLVLCAAALSGCVYGYGHCLFLSPVKTSLRGQVHFRSYPAAAGIDHVPVLTLDRTAYIYAPAHSHSCLSANEVQLTGLSEFPPDIAEETEITVFGSLFESVSSDQHTRFSMNVGSIVPAAPAGRGTQGP